MKVVLVKQIEKVGEAFEVKEVSKGYARNFLFPRGLAVLATKKTLEKVKSEAKIKEKKKEQKEEALQETVKKLSGITIKFSVKSTKAGALFAAVTKKKIAQEIIKTTKLDKLEVKQIKLDKPIKKVGDHEVEIKFGEDLTVKIKVKVSGIATEKSGGKKK